MIILNKKPRHKFGLNEASAYGFTFTLLDGDNQFLHNPFLCKDYFQDMFWTEFTGASGGIYGFDWQKGRINLESPTFKMALICKEHDLKAKIPYLQEFVNYFEGAQHFPLSKVHDTEDAHEIVIEFPAEWITSGPLLSTLTTLIRISGAYKGGDPIAYLKELAKPMYSDGKAVWTPDPLYIMTDAQRLNSTLPRLMAVLEGKKVRLPWEDIKSVGNAHCTGIMGWKEYPVSAIPE